MSATLSLRSNFATIHWRAATHSAREAYKIEEANTDALLDSWFDELMLRVPASVVMAAAALEANANEIIQDILDGSASADTKAQLEALKKKRMVNVIEKYKKVAVLFDKTPETENGVWKRAGLLVYFRNSFMHFTHPSAI